MIAMSTCLLPLFLFLLFPDLTCIPANNRAGMDWTRTVESKGEMSEVGIALKADGTFCAIYCLSRERQKELRARMLDVDPSVLFFGDCADLRNTNASRARSLVNRKKKTASVKPHFDLLDNGKWRCNEPCHPHCTSEIGMGSRDWNRNTYHTGAFKAGSTRAPQEKLCSSSQASTFALNARHSFY